MCVCVCVCFLPGRGADRGLNNPVPLVFIDLKAEMRVASSGAGTLILMKTCPRSSAKKKRGIKICSDFSQIWNFEGHLICTCLLRINVFSDQRRSLQKKPSPP